jgi:hypothetical protein
MKSTGMDPFKRIAAILGVSLLAVISLGKIEKVYLIPFSHQDIGFTGTQLEVERYYIEMYNDLLDFMDSFPDFRFTVETFWQFDCWLRSNPESDLVERYSAYAREGRLDFGAAYGSMHTGFTNDYVISKSLEIALSFAEENGLEISTCLMNDVPGYTADLPDILAEKEIDYFVSGINDAYAEALGLEGSHNLFYWEGPLGNRVLCWVSKGSYAEGYWIKSPSLLQNYLNNLELSGYPYSEVAIMVAFDNAGYFPGAVAYLDLYSNWNDQEVELIVSTPSEFMRIMEEKYGETARVYKGDWSGWWEVVKTGGPFSAGAFRRVQEFAKELDEDLERTDARLKSSLDINLILYGEHTSAVTAGWPGKLTLEQNITSNASVVELSTKAYSQLEMLLREMADELLPQEICVIAPGEGQYYVEIPADIRKGEDLCLKIGGELFAGTPFLREFTDHWNTYSEGYCFLLPLNRGVNVVEVAGYGTNTEEEFDVDKHTLLEWKESENGSIEVIAPCSDGSYLHFDLRLESYLTGSPKTFSQIDATMSSYNRSVNALKEIITLNYCSLPISQITLAAGLLGGIEISVVIDRKELPTVSYKDHSINYVLSLGIEGVANVEYRGARSFSTMESELAGSRPPFLPFQSYMLLDRSDGKTVVASRQSFSFSLDERLRFQLLRHYSYSATSNLGIVPLGENEPGTPDYLVFSFYIDTVENGGFEKAVAFVNLPFVIAVETDLASEERWLQ